MTKFIDLGKFVKEGDDIFRAKGFSESEIEDIHATSYKNAMNEKQPQHNNVDVNKAKKVNNSHNHKYKRGKALGKKRSMFRHRDLFGDIW